MTSYSEINPQTWNAIELLIENEHLRAEAALIWVRAADAGPYRFGCELEALVRELHRNAQYTEWVAALDRLASLQPIRTVNWTFVAESVAQVVDASDTELEHWDERVEEAFGG